MHLIKVTQAFPNEHGSCYAYVLEVEPLVKGCPEMSIALYQETWHRLRRDLYYRTKLTGGTIVPFDAIILLSHSLDANHKLLANILVNNANAPGRANSKQDAKRMIRRMDRLLYELISDGQHDLAILNIAKKFDANPHLATVELKDFLKISYRSKGLFINETDLDYALVANKNRRREAHKVAHPEHFDA